MFKDSYGRIDFSQKQVIEMVVELKDRGFVFGRRMKEDAMSGSSRYEAARPRKVVNEQMQDLVVMEKTAFANWFERRVFESRTNLRKLFGHSIRLVRDMRREFKHRRRPITGRNLKRRSRRERTLRLREASG